MLDGAAKEGEAVASAKSNKINRKRQPSSSTGGENAMKLRRQADLLLNELGPPIWSQMRERSANQETGTGFGMQWARTKDGTAAATWDVLHPEQEK